MTHEHVYVAKKPDENGLVDFSKEENDVWRMLYTRQIKLLEQRACEEFTHGVHKLKLNPDRIPQLAEVSHELKKATGWQVVPVEALISFKEFFPSCGSGLLFEVCEKIIAGNKNKEEKNTAFFM